MAAGFAHSVRAEGQGGERRLWRERGHSLQRHYLRKLVDRPEGSPGVAQPGAPGDDEHRSPRPGVSAVLDQPRLRVSRAQRSRRFPRRSDAREHALHDRVAGLVGIRQAVPRCGGGNPRRLPAEGEGVPARPPARCADGADGSPQGTGTGRVGRRLPERRGASERLLIEEDRSREDAEARQRSGGGRHTAGRAALGRGRKRSGRQRRLLRAADGQRAAVRHARRDCPDRQIEGIQPADGGGRLRHAGSERQDPDLSLGGASRRCRAHRDRSDRREPQPGRAGRSVARAAAGAVRAQADDGPCRHRRVRP